MANQEHVEILKQGRVVWNEWREKNPDIQPHLEGADFLWAVLTGANFSGANLEGTNLEGTHLENANFEGANLRGARLIQANLINANFNGADLTKAHLGLSNLTNAKFIGAKMSGSTLHVSQFHQTIIDETDFDNASMIQTQFSDVDLSTAKGLESVRHGGPSTIGLNTLIKSKGKIPEVFLRGCGVPEEFITYLPSLLANPIEFYSCFISYAHADAAFAHQLHDFLQGRGIRCWLDEHQLKPGHDIRDEIDRGIKLWDKVLLCASESSLNSWWVDKEIERAFKKEESIWKSRNKKVLAIIPLDLDGYIFNGWDSSKAIDVKTRLTCDFKGWQTDNAKLQKQFELVLTALRTDEGREAPPMSRL